MERATRSTLTLFILCASFLLVSGCSKKHKHDKKAPAPPAPAAIDTKPPEKPAPAPAPDPSPVKTQDLTGTLDLDARIPFAEEEPFKGYGPEVGWFFINGELQGKMPFQKRIALVPGKYELRAVFAHGSGAKYWMLSWTATIEKGQTLTVVVRDVVGPSILNGPDAFDEAQAAGRKYDQEPHDTKWSEPPFVEAGGLYTEEGPVTKEAEEIQKRWKRFLDTDGWKAISGAADRLDRSPPSHPRVWLDLQSDLGGARELDLEQLRLLARSYHHYACSALDNWQQRGVTDNLKASRTVLGLDAWVKERIEWVDGVFKGMAAQLERAPGDK